jgi:AmiR/NasT family two-component response regulator
MEEDMRWQEKLLLASIVMLVAISNIRMAGAEDDCGMPTWIVQPIGAGVLCIGEGF